MFIIAICKQPRRSTLDKFIHEQPFVAKIASNSTNELTPSPMLKVNAVECMQGYIQAKCTPIIRTSFAVCHTIISMFITHPTIAITSQ